MPEKRLITKGEAARIIGVSPRTINRYIELGLLTRHTEPFKPFSYRVMLDSAEVKKLQPEPTNLNQFATSA